MTLGQLFGIQAAAKGATFATDDEHMRLAALCQVVRGCNEIMHPRPVSSIKSLGPIET